MGFIVLVIVAAIVGLGTIGLAMVFLIDRPRQARQARQERSDAL